MSDVTLTDIKNALVWARHQSKVADAELTNFIGYGDIDTNLKVKEKLSIIADKRYKVVLTMQKIYEEAAEKLVTELTK